MNKKPNLVIFVADEMRADSLRHLGNKASITPNLDNMVEDGVSFRNAYCQNPVCVPSRCSFLTGWYPHTKGHRTMHYLLEEDDPMLLKTLKENGYHVMWIGRNDVIPADKDLSKYCHEYYPGESELTNESMLRYAEWEKSWRGKPGSDNYYSFYAGKTKRENVITDWNCIDEAIEYIHNLPQNNIQPFCLYISLVFPHPPYACEDPWYSMIDRSKIDDIRPVPKDWSNKASMLEKIYEKQNLINWKLDKFKELRATYLAMVSRVDYQFGLIINALKERNLYDDTSIIMFSDHGDYAGDYGIVEKTQNTFEDPSCRVPLIIKPHKDIKVKPRISNALAELVDLPATIADMANIKLAYTQFGKSLLHVLEGGEEHKDAVFCEGGRLRGETQAMEQGHGPESLYWPRLSTQCEEGPAHTKAVMIRVGNFKYIERLYERNELYDIKNDPQELNNLIDQERYKNLVNKMKDRLLRFYIETADFVPIRKDRRY
ncbi:Arylsulfatase [Tepidanaerobacter acetatoxydans Re1]|uniref:Arylsulfatase n=1 Tax=Tepidanaerobacter acetatoxydans (strain DSM 21804 / JCM 16047 / Re1) TaxID=1209989 RepID=F4LWQ2_TEPAE|nr:sulfatase-like hydrolase/transferase [Tepidanaerobacter acetatoxydans]AEE91774.1 Arylsulfatase [Tepidanaerobacter acetatoxydans Re1]CCP26551.1 Arylsulfatase [Tepidanaerobacter acetatoxydans Re1]